MSDTFFLFLRNLRVPLIVLIVVYSVTIIGMTLVPGVDPQGEPWHMSFFHAFYFVSFMGSTIGFGEIPYEFSDAQRLWVSICIYASVIAWLFTIGTVLRLFQDTAFQQAIAGHAFRKAIRRIGQEFYIICGYGETGRLLTRGLADLNILSVVIDLKPDVLGAIELSELSPLPITMSGDLTNPEVLKKAGVNHPLCRGIIAITQNDHTNLRIAVAVKLINPRLKVICRSESEDEANNMESFGTDVVINPFKTFARRLSLLTHDSKKHRLQSWFVNQHSNEYINLEIAENGLPRECWIVCGYGRFGRSVVEVLEQAGIEIVVVDPNIEDGSIHHQVIRGRGTEANTLEAAGINSASVIVAASNDDANNLSILITAHDLNSQIYSIARVNDEAQQDLYVSAQCDYTMRRSQLVSNEVLTIISRPLVNRFLEAVAALDAKPTEQLISQIEKIIKGSSPATSRLTVSEKHSPALMRMLAQGYTVTIADLIDHSPSNFTKEGKPEPRELALLLQRSNQRSTTLPSRLAPNQSTLLPNPTQELAKGDQLLICHAKNRVCKAQKMAYDFELVDSRIGGNPHHIPLLRWWHRRQRSQNLNKNPTVSW